MACDGRNAEARSETHDENGGNASENSPAHMSRHGSECQPDANFAPALCDEISQYAIQSNCRQHNRKEGKRSGQSYDKSFPSQRALNFRR